MNHKKVYQKAIESIGETLSIESKVNVVGSANIQRHIYYSDYDLFEEINNKSPGQIYSHFRSIYNIFKEKGTKTVVSDLKLGNMHWTENEVMSRTKNGVSFDEALRTKGIIKMDVITLLNGRFIEVTEVYKICFDKKCNKDYEAEEVVREITAEYKEETASGNFMKSLKKMYSLIKREKSDDPRLDVLVDYFNSPIGLLYRCKADLETLMVAMGFSKFTPEDFKSSLELLKELISSFPVENNLGEIARMKDKHKMMKPLQKQVRLLKDFINKDAKKFISKTRL
jgi:hypothetical protein